VGVRGAAPHGGENGAERGGPGFDDMDRHGTDMAAPGCSDSGGQRMPHGRGGRGCDRGGRRGATTRARVADMQDRATSGPVGSDWVREGVRGSEAVARRSLTGGAGSIVPPVRF
jgi:hypothetical protein